jgi:hypothetical protein
MGVDGERIPALTTPRLTDSPALENDELQIGCTQVSADPQTSLSTADNDNFESVQEAFPQNHPSPQPWFRYAAASF